jgi:hypothetical protein
MDTRHGRESFGLELKAERLMGYDSIDLIEVKSSEHESD